MAGYAARRLLAAIPILFVVSFVTFGLIRLAPGDPVLIVLGGRRISPELIDPAARAVRPGSATRSPQYVAWLGRAHPARLRRELQAPPGGRRPHRSRACRSPSSSSPCRCCSPILIGIPLGVLQARRRESAVDYAGSFLAFVGVSSPVYFTAIIGILVFAVWLGWLPAFGQRRRPPRPAPPPDPAGRGAGPRHDRADLADDPQRHARGAGLRLHRGRARQGPAGAHDPLQARPAQRAHPGADGHLAPGRVPRRRHGARGAHDGPRRPGLAHHRRHPEP